MKSTCSFCGSDQIGKRPRGFSIGVGAAGFLVAGPLGLLGGLAGRKMLEPYCENCGKTHDPRAMNWWQGLIVWGFMIVMGIYVWYRLS
jgi:hypothetical protein